MSYRIKQDTKFNLLLGATSTTYADSGSRPTDGTGGSPTISNLTVQSSLEFNRNFLDFSLVHPSSNVQGQGWAFDFNVPVENRAKVLQIEFDYSTTDMPTPGTPTVDSDIIIYMYDVTNSLLIEPSNIKLLAKSTLYDRYSASFQSSSSMAIGRLIFHCATTTTTSFTVTLKNLSIPPSNYIYGSPVTDWMSYTPTGTWVTNTTYTGKWRRVGDKMEVQILVTTSGAPTSATLRINIPSGFTIDTNKLVSTSFDQTSLGTSIATDNGVNNYPGFVWYGDTTSVYPQINNSSGTYLAGTFVTQAVPFTFGATDSVSLSFCIPILGWSSSVQMSDQADTRVVATRAYVGSNQSISNASLTKVNVDSVSFDSNGTYDTANKKYVAPLPGTYDVSLVWQFAANSTGQRVGYIYKNGSVYAQMNGSGNSSAGAAVVNSLISMVTGDYLEFYAFQDSGGSLTLNGSSSNSFVSIKRLSGPSQVATNEVICARYSSSAGQSIANASTVIIDFGTKDFDTHGAVTTGASWKFTAPSPGKYRVSSGIRYTNGLSWTSGGYVAAYLYKNGSSHSSQGEVSIMNTATPAYSGPMTTASGLVQLNAGDYIDIRTAHDESAARALLAVSSHVWIAIERVGN